MQNERRFSAAARGRLRLLQPLGAALLLATSCSRGGLSSGRGASGYVETPVCAASDPAQVVAPQRVALLTSTEYVNTIRLVSDAAGQMIIDNALYPVVTDLDVRFPPSRVEQIKSIPDSTTLATFDNASQAVGTYVRANFAVLTGCASPATDDCATAYLASLAPRAYRRPLTPGEQTRLANLYATLKSQLVNGYQVTLSVEEATGYAVYALLMTPQVLWRWELGATPSTVTPSVYLTDAELASSLAFFLTDRPPDDLLLGDLQGGTLQANLPAHVERLLAAPASRGWLRHVMETYFLLNQLPAVKIDPTQFPIVAGGTVYSDLQSESRLFLDDLLWNGKVTDLLTSRRTFLNTNLATMIYDVPAPAGSTATTFVETTLPADTRAGMLTNAGFLTTRSHSTGVSLTLRGLTVKGLFVCAETGTNSDPTTVQGEIDASQNLYLQSAAEQVAVRQKSPACWSCHGSFDPYGLALDSYDVVGRYRTVDELGKPAGGSAPLPPELGGGTVESAVELADTFATTDAFTNCMATSMLQYALLDATVETPIPTAGQPGCAAAGVAHALRHSGAQSFSDLLRAVITSPSFLERQLAP
jgi:hypothetical protein